jgi:hypothetical protein
MRMGYLAQAILSNNDVIVDMFVQTPSVHISVTQLQAGQSISQPVAPFQSSITRGTHLVYKTGRWVVVAGQM